MSGGLKTEAAEIRPPSALHRRTVTAYPRPAAPASDVRWIFLGTTRAGTACRSSALTTHDVFRGLP